MRLLGAAIGAVAWLPIMATVVEADCGGVKDRLERKSCQFEWVKDRLDEVTENLESCQDNTEDQPECTPWKFEEYCYSMEYRRLSPPNEQQNSFQKWYFAIHHAISDFRCNLVIPVDYNWVREKYFSTGLISRTCATYRDKFRVSIGDGLRFCQDTSTDPEQQKQCNVILHDHFKEQCEKTREDCSEETDRKCTVSLLRGISLAIDSVGKKGPLSIQSGVTNTVLKGMLHRRGRSSSGAAVVARPSTVMFVGVAAFVVAQAR